MRREIRNMMEDLTQIVATDGFGHGGANHRYEIWTRSGERVSARPDPGVIRKWMLHLGPA